MKIRFLLLSIMLVFISGCSTSSRAPQVPDPVPAIRPFPTRLPVSSGVWTITPTTEEQRYRSIASTLLELTDSAGTTRDSIKSAVDFTLSLNRDRESLSYSTTIESMSIQGSQRTGATATSAHLPFSFTGHLQQGKLTVSLQPPQSTAADCSSETLSAATTVQRTVVPMPLLLQKDMTWVDSTTASTCSGSIPVTSISSRHYKVIGATTAGILIERQDKTLSTGEGIQGQHRVRLRSDGTGTAQLVINSQTGMLIESSATHIASVVITASGRDRRFTQTTREQILLR